MMISALCAALLLGPTPVPAAGIVYLPKSQSLLRVQAFTAGAGTYTWARPMGATIADVYVCLPGGGGGAGGYDTSDSGGGGGGGGVMAHSSFAVSALGGSVTVTLGGGGAGGVAKTTAGNGANGGNIGATSFGTFMTFTPSAGAASGGGGTNASGNPGSVSAASYSAAKALDFLGNGLTVGAGADTDGTSSDNVTINSPALAFGIRWMGPSNGGGGGGTNGGVAFKSGGNAGSRAGVNAIDGALITALALGGTTDGANGANGSAGGTGVTGTGGSVFWACGQGGGGGAGAVILDANGGQGGAGGNCGGGGGGGGSTKAGTGNHSGAGGKGGDACILVVAQ